MLARKMRSCLTGCSFLIFVIRLKNIRQYDLSLICNMDETPIWIYMLGNYTLEESVIKTIGMKCTCHEKSRIMVMLAALADGTNFPLWSFYRVYNNTEISLME